MHEERRLSAAWAAAIGQLPGGEPIVDVGPGAQYLLDRVQTANPREPAQGDNSAPGRDGMGGPPE
jgi:hypothetical protein